MTFVKDLPRLPSPKSRKSQDISDDDCSVGVSSNEEPEILAFKSLLVEDQREEVQGSELVALF